MPSLSSILIGAIVALGLALAGTGYWLSNVIESRAVVRASLNSALTANASLIEDRKRALAEAERNRQISATAMREARAIDEKIGRLKEKVMTGAACLIDPADAAALDALFQ